jgi:hypothetical protein
MLCEGVKIAASGLPGGTASADGGFSAAIQWVSRSNLCRPTVRRPVRLCSGGSKCCSGGSVGRIQIQVALEDPSAGSKCIVRWRIRFEPTRIRLQDSARWHHLQNECRVATGDSCAGGEGVCPAPLTRRSSWQACPARAQRSFLFIVASSASVCTAAGSASSIAGCAEDALRPERPAPLETGGTWLMDRFASRWE